MAYDLIGDIHGCAESLQKLLSELGYEKRSGCYRHNQRKVIFLGDFIDRGPFQRETIEIVRPMIESGAALSVMGNHEFNALAYHTEDGQGSHLRKHTDKNNHQHRAFLDAYPPGPERDDAIAWFYTLPVFLELESFRVVHAAWLPQAVAKVRNWAPDGLLNPNLVHAASQPGSDQYINVEILLKGWETELPDGVSFADKDGNVRTRMRTKWWEPIPARLPEAALGTEVPDVPFQSPDTTLYPNRAPNVFVGHYWLKGPPRLWAPNICCLDYSVAKDGNLVAYRWDGESRLSKDNFVAVPRQES